MRTLNIYIEARIARFRDEFELEKDDAQSLLTERDTLLMQSLLSRMDENETVSEKDEMYALPTAPNSSLSDAPYAEGKKLLHDLKKLNRIWIVLVV